MKSWCVIGILVAVLSGAGEPARAQAGRRPAEVEAEQLGKEFAADAPDPAKTYRGRMLRVKGRVSAKYEAFVEMNTGVTDPAGHRLKVTLQFPSGAMPDVALGDLVVVQGKFSRRSAFGPVLSGCSLVRREPGAPAAEGDGGVAMKRPEPGGVGASADPRGIALTYDGSVRAGEPGYREGWASVRLRFGPGEWRGAVAGRCIAWGDGDRGNNHWGMGSDEAAEATVIADGAEGAYLVFSVKGTEWDSSCIGALIRLTLPDGRHAVATAVFPFGEGP